MHIPRHFEQPDIAALHALVAAHPLTTLVTHGTAGFRANHLPMDLDPNPQPFGSLLCHVARANPLWRELSDGAGAIAIFHGPQAYVSPSWYPSKAESGKVVPTWNYVVVHAHGTLRVIDDARWVKAQIEKLTIRQEAGFAHPWAVSDAPVDYTQTLLGSIVGIEIAITRLEGKWKASQNRTEPDRSGVAAGLRATGAYSMADFVERSTG